jgi:spermidine synthase
VETLIADGRNHLFATGETFDAVVGDLFAPWQAGTGYLYTREHFESVRGRLAPGGVYVQWLPAHQLTVDELRIIAATFLDVFPKAELWRYGFQGAALVGRAEGAAPPLDRAAAESSERFAGLTPVCGPETLASFTSGAPRNTDAYPRIEFSAAVTRFAHGGSRRAMRDTLSRLGTKP